MKNIKLILFYGIFILLVGYFSFVGIRFFQYYFHFNKECNNRKDYSSDPRLISEKPRICFSEPTKVLFQIFINSQENDWAWIKKVYKI